MIHRIYIDGYKSLREVEIGGLGALSVFYGANATGKSNLFDALDLLAHLVREDSLLQAFQLHRGSRASRPLPARQFFSVGQPTPLSMTFELDFELAPGRVGRLNDELADRERRDGLQRAYTRVTQHRLRYRVVLNLDAEARSLTVSDESLVPLTKAWEPHTSIVPYIRSKSGEQELSVKLERQGHPRSFTLPRARTVLSEVGDAVNHPHLVAAARELQTIRIFYIEPTRMRSEVSDLEAHDPGANGERLASFFYWLHRTSPIRFKNLEHNLSRLVPGFSSLTVTEAVDGFLQLWVEEEGRGSFPASLVSEGTLRLLCLLGILATPEPPSLVGYEEPENGVHPGRLREMMGMLQTAAESGTAQFLLTTHSDKVLDILEHVPRFRAVRATDRTRFERESDLPLVRSVERQSSLGARVARGDLG